jgi:hypothetical protein
MGETRGEAHTSLPSGERIGPDEVIARVGAGGMGEVYPSDSVSCPRAARAMNQPPSIMPGPPAWPPVPVGRSRRLHIERLIASQFSSQHND